MEAEREPYINSLSAHLGREVLESISIAGRKVGKGHPTFIIAEVGSNHHGDLEEAKRYIEESAKAGADAVKFQHLNHETIAAPVPITFEWNGKKSWKSFSDFYIPSSMPYEWTDELIAHCERNGILFMSTPFDLEGVKLLNRPEVPAIKVASYELTCDPLLERVAATGKPVIISTGMAYLDEVAHAVRILQEGGTKEMIILQCTSLYPPKDLKDLNLPVIKTLRNAFHVPSGYSDHSTPPSLTASLLAVAEYGASMIERHVTLNREGSSHDDKNSLDIKDLARLVSEIRTGEEGLKKGLSIEEAFPTLKAEAEEVARLKQGSPIKQPVSYPGHERDEIWDRWARRSVYAAQDIPAGSTLNANMLICLRPIGGLEPRDFKKAMGRSTKMALKKGEPLTWDHI